MSSLFGALSLGVQPLPEELGVRMAAALAARPADALGCFQEGPLLLGARSVWLSEEEAGQVAPYRAPHGRALGILDGRLDHPERLAHDLGLEATPSDTALMVSAYLRWGEDFVARLQGDFALAVWDPARRSLLLARDALGVRPLYWAQTPSSSRAPGTVLFASQARPLFAHPQLARVLDPLRIAQYLTSTFAESERSFFGGVERLAPGHLLVVTSDGGAPRKRRYFAFDRERELPQRSNAEFAEQFRELFVDAVRVRTRTTKPLACLLSGGLDSSGLLGVLKTLEPARSVPCFSARFVDFPEIDEGHWLALWDAPEVIRAELRADRICPLDSIDSLHAALDEPFHAPNLFIYEALARLARDHGTRVLLDGLDGDTVVDHGYFALRELLFAGRPRRFASALRALHRSMGFSYRELLRDFVFEPEGRAFQGLLARAAFAHVPEGVLKRLSPLGYLSVDFARQSGLTADLEARAEPWLAAPRSLRAHHHRALTDPILPFYLEVYDKVAASLGVEHRHPYFDRTLIEFCLALPSEQRLFQGWDRVIQRRAFTGLIPEPIRARQSKSVWTRNFERQLLGGGHHRERIRALIDSPASPLAGYCDLARLRRDLPALEAGELPERVMDFWSALSLGLWLEVASASLSVGAQV